MWLETKIVVLVYRTNRFSSSVNIHTMSRLLVCDISLLSNEIRKETQFQIFTCRLSGGYHRFGEHTAPIFNVKVPRKRCPARLHIIVTYKTTVWTLTTLKVWTFILELFVSRILRATMFCYICTDRCLAFGAHGNVFDIGTMLQAGRSSVRFPKKSLDFSIGLIIPAALRPWGRLSL
jgi:hypothetical protein